MSITQRIHALANSMGLSISRYGESIPGMPSMKFDGFVKGPAPRGGWPIKLRSTSKYTPHQGAKEKARRLRQMGAVELQQAA